MITAADKRILRVLQSEGRITNQELAQRCGLSSSACLDRMKRLREQGYITGFMAMLDPVKLDHALLIFIEISLNRTSGDLFRQFAEAARTHSEILECHMVAGGFDYLMKVRVQDMSAYRRFLSEKLVEMPGVRETRTYAVLEEVKCTTELAI